MVGAAGWDQRSVVESSLEKRDFPWEGTRGNGTGADPHEEIRHKVAIDRVQQDGTVISAFSITDLCMQGMRFTGSERHQEKKERKRSSSGYTLSVMCLRPYLIGLVS